MRWNAAVLLLALGVACDPYPTQVPSYGPEEEGLTLQYENPETGGGREKRLQARVASAKDTPQGRLVRVVYTSLENPPLEMLMRFQEGGAQLLTDPQSPGITVLPKGFPDRVSQWEARGTRFKVLGRAEAKLPGISLPASSRLGVWVESESPRGDRTRILFLPGIGEAESLTWKNHQWVCVNRLVSRGFTDAPVAAQPQNPSSHVE